MKKTINVLGIRKRMILYRTREYNKQYVYVMQPLTKEQEDAMDNSVAHFEREKFVTDGGFTVVGENIKLYGEFNPDSDEDLDYIEKFNLIDEENGCWIPSSFDYDNGTIIENDKRVLDYPTTDVIKWFMYCYCLIGKPERIIVYKLPKAML